MMKFIVGDKSSDRFILGSEDGSILIIGEYESDGFGGVKRTTKVFAKSEER